MDGCLYRARPWAITLVLHNWPVMLYAVGIACAAVNAYLAPNRRRLLLLFGLLTLAFAFEYEKHAVPALRGTTNYLFSLEFNPAPRRASQVILLDLAPIAAHAFGLFLLVGSLVPPPGRWRRTRRAAPHYPRVPAGRRRGCAG
jgi:hypothetical protein